MDANVINNSHSRLTNHVHVQFLLQVVVEPGLLIWLLFSTEVVYETGEGNGTPLQYSCLENPMDGGAWQAAAGMPNAEAPILWPPDARS